MAAPTRVQQGSIAFTTESTDSVTLGSPVTSGNSLIAVIGSTTNGVTLSSVVDDQANSWASVQSRNTSSNRVAAIYAAHSCAGATTQITITFSGNTSGTQSIEELTPCTTDASGNFGDTGATTFYHAGVGEIDTSTDVLVYTSLVTSGNRTTVGHADYTDLVNANRRHQQYRSSDAALTDQRAEVTTTESTTNYDGVIAAFTAAAGGPPPAAALVTRSLMGVGA